MLGAPLAIPGEPFPPTVVIPSPLPSEPARPCSDSGHAPHRARALRSRLFSGIALVSGLAHAAWNALVKSSGDKPLDTALVHLMGAVVAVPFALWAGLPTTAALPFMATSLVIHIGYYIALAGAYQDRKSTRLNSSHRT